jgi:hypothetical protein
LGKFLMHDVGEGRGTNLIPAAFRFIQFGFERYITMKSLVLASALAIMAAGLTGVVEAGTISIYDHFTGESLDTSKWTRDEAGPLSFTESVVTLGDNDWWSTLRSKQTFDPTTQQSYLFGYAGSSGDLPRYFGLSTALTADPYESVIFEIAPTQSRLLINGVQQGSYFASPAVGDVIRLTRTANTWQIYDNSTLVAESGSGQVAFSQGSVARFALQARWGYSILSMDYVGTETIPEPSTLLMVVTGLFGLLAYAWRKRR